MKRLIDVLVASALLVLLAPLLACVSLLVRVRLGTPVLFRQVRPGRDERPFIMLKFRTMREPRPGEERSLSDSVRLTPFGRLLRRTSLDELPELWNVLLGDMSLVGPRPLLSQYLPYYTPRERIRFQVRPGITGLAQLRGRNASSWSDRLAWDVEYVRAQSLWMDMRILLETPGSVLGGHNVVVDPHSVMLNLDEERREMPSPAALRQ